MRRSGFTDFSGFGRSRGDGGLDEILAAVLSDDSFGMGGGDGRDLHEVLDDLFGDGDSQGFGSFAGFGRRNGGGEKQRSDDNRVNFSEILDAFSEDEIDLLLPVEIDMADDYAKMALENMQNKRAVEELSGRCVQLMLLVLRREHRHQGEIKRVRTSVREQIEELEADASKLESADSYRRDGLRKASGLLADLKGMAMQRELDQEFVDAIDRAVESVLDTIDFGDWLKRTHGFPSDRYPRPTLREEERKAKERMKAEAASSQPEETTPTGNGDDAESASEGAFEVHDEISSVEETGDGKTDGADRNDENDHSEPSALE